MSRGHAAKGRCVHPGKSWASQWAARAGACAPPAPLLPPAKDSQLAALALFSTSLSTNQDQNHTNMLKSPPKLLFWFQDDAIWVPVLSLQMQAGGGERKAAETRLRSKPPARKRSCRALLNQTLPWVESCSPGRCKSSIKLYLMPTGRPHFPGTSSKTSGSGPPACTGSVPAAAGPNLGRLRRASPRLDSIRPPRDSKKTHIPDPDSGSPEKSRCQPRRQLC